MPDLKPGLYFVRSYGVLDVWAQFSTDGEWHAIGQAEAMDHPPQEIVAGPFTVEHLLGAVEACEGMTFPVT